MGDEVEKLFNEVDTSHDGKISLKELGRMFKQLGMQLKVSDVRRLIYQYDTDASGDIDIHEFRKLISSLIDINTAYCEAYEAFKMFDIDGSNTLTADEVKQVCKTFPQKLTDAEIEELIKRMDTDGNGVIDFIEFSKAFALGI